MNRDHFSIAGRDIGFRRLFRGTSLHPLSNSQGHKPPPVCDEAAGGPGRSAAGVVPEINLFITVCAAIFSVCFCRVLTY